MAKYILKHNKLVVLNSKGKAICSFKVKDPMEGMFDKYPLIGTAIVKDTFAMTQAQYHGAYYVDN